MVDGGYDDEAETEDRCGAEGEDRAGGAPRAGDRGGVGHAVRGSPEPDLRLEEATAGERDAGLRTRHWGGCARAGTAGNGGAVRQDRPTDSGTRFFVHEVRPMSKADRQAMLDRSHPELSLRRQCVLLGLARSGVYRAKAPDNDTDLAVRRRLDELFTAYPFLGLRRMAAMLRADAAGRCCGPMLRADAAGRGGGDQPQACATADAHHGDRRPRTEAADDEAGTGA